jgi:predicted transcriptional regulator
MPRRTILDVTKDVIKTLKKEKELSVKSVSVKVNSQWSTTIKSLEFLKGVGIVKERKGRKTNKDERLFSLTDEKAKYN